MKLTRLLKIALYSIPSYQERVLTRKAQQFERAKAQLLTASKRQRIFNHALQQPEHVHSQGVQEVLRFYDQEIISLYTSLNELKMGNRAYKAVPIKQVN